MLRIFKSKKPIAVALLIVSSFVLGSFTSILIGPGLTQAVPINAYLNNNLPSTTTGTPPQLLSQTGAFSDLINLTPTPGVIPYDMIQPFWSDGADKSRWMAIPNNGSHNTPAERIQFSNDGNWVFPIGAVLIKHFELGGRRLETRFEVRASSGDYYYLSYKWNNSGTDAQLLTTGLDETIIVNGQSQVWHYPSIAECQDCHKASVNRVLGPKTRQLNRDIRYPETGIVANQLVTLSHLGIISENITDSNVNNYIALAAQDDQSYSLEYRARSYLDVNCSYCHQPATNMRGNFDARITTPLEQQNLIDGGVFVDLGVTNPRVITPQNTSKSIAHIRMNSTQAGVSMPPLGKNVIDDQGVQLIADWINNLQVSNNNVQADIAASVVQGPAPLSINFDASASIGNNLNYNWDFGDGSTGSGRITSHVYTQAGVYAVNLTVNDGSSSDIQDLFVNVTAVSTSITFADKTSFLSGANFSGVAMSVVDMNGDGRDDIVRYNQARNLNIQYQRGSNQSFSSSIVGNVSNSGQWSNAIADVDQNGFNDIITAGYYDDIKLLTNSGQGFTTTLIPDSRIFIQGSNFADINNDGWVDIFACHDDADSREFLNNGNGTFTYAPSAIDTRTNPVSDNSGNYASIWTDYDNDGDLDLYISKCRGGVTSSSDPRRINTLYQNDGNNNYTEVAAAANLKIGAQSWLADFADIDNDGDMDVIVLNHGSAANLMLNNGNGTFVDITASSGLLPYLNGSDRALQGFFRDFDNDGFVDLLVTGEDHFLFHNEGNRTFSIEENPFTSDKMATMAIGDLNHDGFLDVYGGYNRLYNNPSNIQDRLFINNGNPNNHFITIQLEGTISNINGIGARVELYGAWGKQIREVRSGEGYGVVNSFDQHFGLGTNTTIAKVIVNWPSGIIQEIQNPTADQFLSIVETNNNNNCAPGTTCNDSDPCTVNDRYDSNCNCIGTFQDSDSDGICDANDNTNGNCSVGQACNDNDPCTVSDSYDSNCNCVGTFQDSDSDGICDANDNTNGNCSVGQACNDNDPCTVSDSYDSNCNCVGTFQDSDSDGICDANDNTNGNCIVGQTCNDNDPCTVNDRFDSNCNCIGTVQDSDNDGVCNFYDVCNGFNDNFDTDNDGIPNGCDDCNNALIGTSCDDGSICTIGESYDQNCNCTGGTQLNDGDGDGYCSAEDPNDSDPCVPVPGPQCEPSNQNCSVFSNTGFENGAMDIWIDGGAAARVLNNSGFARTGNYSFYIQDGNGIGSSFYTSQLDLVTAESVSLSYYHLGYALENQDSYVLEYSTNGTSFTQIAINTSGVEISNSSYSKREYNLSGPFSSTTIFRFRAISNDASDYFLFDDIQIELCQGNNNPGCNTGQACNDNDVCTINDVLDANCNCVGTYQDTDSDGICNANDNTNGNCYLGQPCNDNDRCTINDVYDSNCNCSGTFQDSDSDGVCDANDNSNGNCQVGQSCNDNDVCTINDVYDSNCNCSGTYVDSDNDGICDALDTPSGDCQSVTDDDFESTMGQWIDGGADVLRNASSTYSNSGLYCIRLRDNSGAASSLSMDNIALSQSGSTFINFSFYPESMEPGEDFLLEIGVGNNYSTIKQWVSGQDFQNNVRQQVRVNLSAATTQSVINLRIRCDASSNYDIIYLDDIVIENCGQQSNCVAGQTCQDGNPCTTGEVYDSSCNCVGGVVIDNDNDGYCATEDQNDNDPCIPDDSDCNTGSGSDPCVLYDSESFETGLGLWNDGGSDAFIGLYAESTSGIRSVRLRDNSGINSSIYTNSLNLATAGSLLVKFNFFPSSMESGEDLILEVSNDSGSNFIQVRNWVSGTDFQNDVPQVVSEEIPANLLSAATIVRIRCDASSNYDRIYLDDLQLEICTQSNIVNDGSSDMMMVHTGQAQAELPAYDLVVPQEDISDLHYRLYPNPAYESLILETNDPSAKAVLIDSNGQRISEYKVNEIQDISELESGLYFIIIKNDTEMKTMKFIKI